MFRKTLIARCLTLLVLALLSTNLAWGAETELSESLDLTTKTEGCSAYNTSTAYGDWTIVNGANNNKGWAYFKMGGKSATISSSNPCYIYYSANSGVSSKVDKITVSIAAGSLSKSGMSVNSWGVYVYSDKAMTTQIDYVAGGTITNSAATFDFTPSAGKTWAADSYYKVSWDLANTTTTNGIVCVDKVTLYSISDAPDPVLQSIAISGTPTKTAYETGESFDVTGLTVTGTYDDTSTDDLTDDAEWTINPATFTSTSQNSVSVTATIGEKSDTKNYTVTVTEHVVTPGTYTISLNNALYGISTGNNGTEQSATVNDITVVSGCSSSASTKTYYDIGHIRYYAGSYLKLSVPAGCEITSVVFTEPSSSKKWDGSITSTPDSYNADTKTWTGKSQNVDFAFGAQNRAASITVIYEVKKTLESIAVETVPTKIEYKAGEFFDPAGLVIKATYDTGDPEDITYAGNENKFTFNPDLTTALTTANTSVTITYGGKSVDQAITVNLNKLTAPTNLQATNIASTSATLTWGEVANASKYEVKLNGIDAKTVTTNSLLVKGLTASTTYTWTVKAKGDNTTYDDSDESLENEFTTLAPPSVAYTVTFNGNEHGTPASASITETEAGAGVTLPNCTPNAGYQFVGWATTNTATEADAGEAEKTYYPTENITLYAVYNEVYTIKYMVNGTNTNPQVDVEEGTTLVFPEVSAPDADHVFCGWVKNAIEGTQPTAPEYVNTTGLTASENITYYAVFAERSGSEPAEQKTQTLQYDTWTYYGSTTDKDTYRLFHSGSYIESAEFDLSKLTKVIVYGGTFGGSSYNSLTIGDGTNTWKSVTVSGSSQTGVNTYTEGTALSGTGKLRVTSNSGSASGSGSGIRISKVEIFTMEGGYTYTNYCTTVVTKTLKSISLSGGYPTEFWKGDAFSHEGMTVTAHYENAADENVTDKATFTDYDMATAGEQTVTVTYETASTTYNITVKTIANTQETAYTTAEAIDLIDANPAELTITEVYVKGTVSKVDSYNSQYKSITYWLDNDAFEVYSGKNLNYTDFTSIDDVTVGDDVIIYGIIKKFNSTYEFDKNNYLVYHDKVATLSINDITVEIGGTITPVIETNVVGNYMISYTSDNEEVVLADGDEMVTMGLGEATITATLTAKGYKDAETTFTVEVIKALTSIEIAAAPTTTSYKVGDKFDPTGLVITANYNNGSTEDVAYAGNEDKFTFTPSLETPLTTENTSVTITYAGKETTQTIEVRALDTYDITWMANGIAVTLEPATVVEGNVIGTLPTPDAENIPTGFGFAGWSNSESSTATIGETYIVDADVTLYAVFSREEGGTPGSGNYEKVTNISDIISGEYIITATFNNTEYTMKNGKVSAKNLVAYSLESQNLSVENNAIVGNAINNSWTFTGTNNSMTITSTKETQTCYLYATNTNNGMVVGSTSDTWSFTAVDNTDLFYMKDSNQNRYLSLYDGLDWRCYTNTNNGVPKLALYKKDEGTPGVTKYYTRVFTEESVDNLTVESLMIIPEGQTLTVTNGLTIANNSAALTIEKDAIVIVEGTLTNNGAFDNLVIKDGGQLVFNNSNVKATVEKNIIPYSSSKDGEVKGWHFLAAPMEDFTVESFIKQANGNYDLYRWYIKDNGDPIWYNYKAHTNEFETEFLSGRGYLAAYEKKDLLKMQGTLNAGTTFSFTVNSKGNFTLLGNPFTYDLKWSEFTKGTGIFDNGFAVVNSETGIIEYVAGTTPIKVGTGFMVYTEENEATLSFTKGNESGSGKSNDILALNLFASNGNGEDNTIIVIDDENGGFAKADNFNTNVPQIYTERLQTKYGIRNFSTNTKEFFVSFKAVGEGSNTIRLETIGEFDYVHLYDKLTDVDVDMLLEGSYTFEASEGDDTHRFIVRIDKGNTGIDENETENFVNVYNGEIHVSGSGEVQIFDVMGRIVHSEVISGDATISTGGFKGGVYVVRLIGNGWTKTEKIVVRR